MAAATRSTRTSSASVANGGRAAGATTTLPGSRVFQASIATSTAAITDNAPSSKVRIALFLSDRRGTPSQATDRAPQRRERAAHGIGGPCGGAAHGAGEWIGAPRFLALPDAIEGGARGPAPVADGPRHSVPRRPM